MFILIAYDVNTQTAEGRTRLRKVAKCCVDYGQRVQNSVFECIIDTARWVAVKDRLLKIVDTGHDSVRFYYLGDERKRKTEHFGVKPDFETDGIIMI